MIPFNEPLITGKELAYLREVVESGKLSGDGKFTKACHSWFENRFKTPKALLTTSGTHALEMAALLTNAPRGREVIMPSFTFTSTANAFLLHGFEVVFVDIRPDTMNMDETLVEEAITERTAAIVPVHYAGVSCDMDPVLALAKRKGLAVIEDAAQGMMSTYKGKALGTLGDFGAFSFHETKNYTCGEGGAILINSPEAAVEAEIIREKGTNRSRFLRGEVDKYTWVNIGSSYLPSELNAAFLYAQLEHADSVLANRLATWNLYREALSPLEKQGRLGLPHVPADCTHNGHIFYVKTANLEERDAFIAFLREHGIRSTFHYVPLHSAPYGVKKTITRGSVHHTVTESDRLVRLPMFHNMGGEQVDRVCTVIHKFFS